MSRIIVSPDGEKIDLDGPPPSIDELCERILKPIAEETGLSTEFLKTGERAKVREALKHTNEPLIRNYHDSDNTGYPYGNRFISKEKLEELHKKAKRYLDAIE